MAKEDFCFTYYDGDAARDKAHMTRLQRGAYDDLISAQRKRGHLSLEDIKRVLSKDFDECWPAMEWILLKDEAGKFFIEWVDKSIEKMRRQSEKQKENVSKRWKKDTNNIPPYNDGIDLVIPLVNENEDGNEDVLEDKIVLSKNGFFANELSSTTELSKNQIENSCEFIFRTCNVSLSESEIINRWKAFLLNNQVKKWYNSFDELVQHFRNSLKNELKNGFSKANNATGNSKEPGSASRAKMQALRDW